ncbi:MAG: alpha amylase N-terminal ig-like domain-containing protein [Lachnospiraceae bacterium]|nr:alpha amylase N-terminal ig-like domain-containing protein [Lachnospiraceae bacterium]
MESSLRDNLIYILSMRPVFNYKAVYADMTEDYVFPIEPEPNSSVALRFRTGRNNVDDVFICVRGGRHRMTRISSEGLFDYYEGHINVENEPFFYHFEMVSGNICLSYGRSGLESSGGCRDEFKLVPGIKTPEWSRGAVMYQIFTDRFYNGDPSNDVQSREYYYLGDYAEKVEDWDYYPDSMDVRRFYGGDLKGVLDKLPYIKELGVDVIYFNPLFVSPSNHKYDSQDYDHIDPHYGVIVEDGGECLKDSTENRFATKYIKRVTSRRNLEASNEIFAELVRRAHEMGIKVIIDGVFNHCGSFNKWLDREKIYENGEGYASGAYSSADSPYRSFFRFFDENKWPDNDSYDGWWGHDTLPKLNYEDSPELYSYILGIAKKWVSPPYNADGWRLDVAADLGHTPEFNHRFWKDFRAAVREANPDAIVLAEHYGDAESWIANGEWDTIMNYDAFMEPISWFLTGMQKHSDEYRQDLLNNPDAFWSSMRAFRRQFLGGSGLAAMNELSNHDHSRFLTRTNHKVGRVDRLGSQAAEEGVNKAVMREAVLFQMTWPGAPTIYYGDEAGLCGFTDPDNRRTYPWGNEDFELIDFHRACIRIHKENKELMTGSMIPLLNDGDEEGILSFARFNRDGASVIILNNNDRDVEWNGEVWTAGIPSECTIKRLLITADNGFTTETLDQQVRSGRLRISVPKTGGVILKYQTPTPLALY